MIGHAFYVLCLNFHNFKFGIIIFKIGNEIIKKYMISNIVKNLLLCNIYNNMSKLNENL